MWFQYSGLAQNRWVLLTLHSFLIASMYEFILIMGRLETLGIKSVSANSC